MKTHPLLTLLKKACAGLLFRSETEAELEPFCWEDGGPATRIPGLTDTEIPVEEMDLKGFFRAVSKADRPAFNKLAKVLEEHLDGVKVYKIGEVEKEVYIVGKTCDGHWAGVKTRVVET